MEIRQVGPSEIDAAVALILEVFLQFDAPDDSEEGIRSFRVFVEDGEIRQTLLFFGAFEQGELKGVIVIDDAKDHICCFFVKAGYHRQGIGKKLWEYVLDHSEEAVFTVHASPYAVPIYHKFIFNNFISSSVLYKAVSLYDWSLFNI